jgi:regulatory protein
MVWQRKDSNRCSIHLDGEFAFGIHVDLIASHGLRKGRKLTTQECAGLLDDDLYYRSRSRIMRFLEYRPRSEREVRQRLALLEVPAETADRLIRMLLDTGLLDDVAFGRMYARSRLGKYGPARVRMDLLRKGIQGAEADTLLASLMEEVDLESRLDDLIRKADARYRRESDPRIRERKIIRWLAGRGYRVESIREALRRSTEKT